MNFFTLFLIWVVATVIVLLLALYRKILADRDVPSIHVLDNDADVVPQQAVIAKRLDNVDRWGKILTILVVVYGLALGAAYMYKAWQTTAGINY
jgi:hypothetical protein